METGSESIVRQGPRGHFRRLAYGPVAATLLMCSLCLGAALEGPVHREYGDSPQPAGRPSPPSGTSLEPVTIRLTHPEVALSGFPTLVTIELVDTNGRVLESNDPYELQVDLGGSCIFTGVAAHGSVLAGMGMSHARVMLDEGRADLLLSNARAETASIEARNPAGLLSSSSGDGLRFLAQDADTDGDGMTNLEEFRRGTNPLSDDTDDDGVTDPFDNCPVVANPDQSDSRHPGAGGDACDDPDDDGVFDIIDNCPDWGNPAQEDRDGDGTGDACQDGTQPLLANGAFTLPFQATDVVIDPRRPYLYATDKAGSKIWFINLETGQADAVFPFYLKPESLALSPDGSRLYGTLLKQEHTPYPTLPKEAYIAVFDLDGGLLERAVRIDEDPYDMLVTSDGHLVVSPGSGQSVAVRVFDIATGIQTGTTSINFRSQMRLGMHPSGTTVYAADTTINPGYLRRFDLLPAGNISVRWTRFPAGHRIFGHVWPSPLGDVVITEGGDIFATGATAATDLIFTQELSQGSIDALAYDAAGRVIFTGEGSTLRYYNLLTYLEIGSTPMAGTVDFVGLSQQTVYSVLVEAGQTVVVGQPHPAPGGASNLPPTARFTVDPATGGTTNDQFRLDASASTDAQDPLGALRFRWDFQDDGIWDTPWSTTPVVTKRYPTPGRYSARLQLRDTLGLLDETTQTFDVRFTIDPGEPGPAGPPFEFPFSVTDAVVDPQRPYLYVSDKAGRRICFMNLQSGLIEKQFTFDLMPEALAMTPDGSRLFAGLLTREHSGVWWDADGHEGYIASFDLSTMVEDRQFRITEDPSDLGPTSNGLLVVSSGSGQHTYVRVFDATTGAETGASYRPYQQQHLALHPGERKVYMADGPHTSPSDLYRYDLTAAGQITYRWDSPYHGDYRTGRNVWVSPEGDKVIAGGGDVFSVGETSASDLRFLQQLSPGFIDNLAFDEARKVILTAEGSTLASYNLASYLEIRRESLPGPIAFLGASGPSVYALIRESARTVVEVLPHPAPNGASNQPPDARFTVSPSSGGTILDEFRFDASLTTDAEDPASALQYRWDFDNDLVWDTAWSGYPMVTWQFSDAGTKIVRLQVRDSLALVGEATQAVHVALVSDPAQPGPPTAAFELPFLVTDAVFDPVRPYLYVTDMTGRRVCFVNLETGLVEQQFSFTMLPETLALTPDGSRLFVSLLDQEQPYTNMPGAIASFDLLSQVKDRQFGLPIEPVDLLATSNGQLVISSYVSPKSSIKTFDAANGNQLGSSYDYSYEGRLQLALDPSERKIYATGDSSEDMRHFDLLPTGAVQHRWLDTYRGAHRVGGNLWSSPLGDILITRGGDVFTTTDASDTDMRFVESLSAGRIESMAFDAARRAFFAAEGSVLRSYNLETRLPMRDRPLTGSISFVGFQGDSIYALLRGTTRTNVIAFEHPALSGASNTAPVAHFTTTPSPATTRVDVSFDASPSSDAEETSSWLRFRWDLDNNGVWDGPWSADPMVTRRFHTHGTKIIRLQALDSLGLVDESTQLLDVSFENDPGEPGAPAAAFELPFAVTDAVFDPIRPYLYVSDKAGRRVHFINLATGFIDRIFSFADMPEALAITPDGSRLFAALQSREHFPYSPYSGVPGSIASFDLENKVKDRQFEVPIEVRDLVATTTGVIVAVPYAGYGGSLRTFDGVTGAQLGISAELYPRGALALALHPSEHLLYGGDSGVSPPDTLRFDLSPGGAVTYRWDSPYHGQHRLGSNLWVSPLGDVLITRGGDVFTVNGSTYSSDMNYVRTLAPSGLSALAWDAGRDLILTLEGKYLRRYRLSTYDLVESTQLPGNGSFLGRHGSAVFALLPDGSDTQILRQAVSNRPPVAHAGGSRTLECSGMLGASATLDASSSSDPDSMDGLWDDIALYEWFEIQPDGSGEPLATGERTEAFLPLGVHQIRLRVTDSLGAVAEDDVTVSVEDTMPPDLRVVPQPALLWPPNHRMVDVHLQVTAVDQCDPGPAVFLVGATSSEPDDEPGPSDGHTDSDIQEAGVQSPDVDVMLRAERSGTGSGRTYRLTYSAVDFAGLVTEAEGLIAVPHDQGSNTLDPLDVGVRQEGNATLIEAEPPDWSIHYRGIRGDVRNLEDEGSTIGIGPVNCLDVGSNQPGIVNWSDTTTPPVGQAWFYLVEYDDGSRSSYGSMQTGRERVTTAVECAPRPGPGTAGGSRLAVEDDQLAP